MILGVLANPDSWYLGDLRRAAEDRHEIVPLRYGQLSAALQGTQAHFHCGPASLAPLDAVLVRSMPPASLEQVVFRMDVLARVEANGTPVINPPKALEAAIDKYLSLAKLQSAGLRVPETWCGQSPDEALEAYAALGGDVVVKPLFGGEGRGITRINDAPLAQRAFKMLHQLGAVIYLQRFIDHGGCDLRMLVIGSQILAMRRRHSSDWRTNISLGASAEPFEADDELLSMARAAVQAIGAPLAGVDIVEDRDGRRYVLEINAVPGWRALRRALDVDVAALVLQFVEESL